MPLFDVRCEDCQHREEVSKAFHDPATCPECGSGNTKTLMPAVKGIDRAKDPFDQIGMGQKVPDPKSIKSFAHDRRKGGKDTT